METTTSNAQYPAAGVPPTTLEPEDPALKRRWIWLGLGLCVACIVATIVDWALVRTNMGGIAYLALAVICLGIVTVLAPASTARRGWTWAFWGPFCVATLAQGQPSLLGWFATMFIVVLATGGWITLRGRNGLGYLTLIVALVLGFGLLLALGRIRGFGSDIALQLVGAAAFLACVVFSVWIAALLSRAQARSRAARADSLAYNGGYAAGQPMPGQAMPGQALAGQPAPGQLPPGQAIPDAAGQWQAAQSAPRSTNPLAIASLVLGIIGGSVLGIIFGHVARSQNKRTGQGGSGMALAGLILSYIWLAIAVGFVIYVVVIVSQSSSWT